MTEQLAVTCIMQGKGNQLKLADFNDPPVQITEGSRGICRETCYGCTGLFIILSLYNNFKAGDQTVVGRVMPYTPEIPD